MPYSLKDGYTLHSDKDYNNQDNILENTWCHGSEEVGLKQLFLNEWKQNK